jgi:Tubulin binding cofactor A
MSTQKALDIRIGALKRLIKEMNSRRVDVVTEKKRTERFISEGEDKWTVNKQVTTFLREIELLERSCGRGREDGS